MRPPALQYFYLEKPMTLLILITFISVVFWIGKGEFYTKGEPREASVAVSMLEKNRWILPEVYAGETAYKPPFTHWMTAVFSLPQGKVTPFTSRLPSALAFVGLIVTVFLFFGNNLKLQDAFLSALILLTSFELHRAAMTARVDMMLTFLIVLALTLLFRWEERKKLKGFPVLIVLIQSMATLTKGPVGILLPLLVFGIYLLFLRYNVIKIALKLLPLALASLILPLLWYYLAYLEGGKAFLDVVWAENFGRFLGMENLPIHYYLGHEEPWWYNFLTLAAGFIPWTILLFISLFGLRYTKKLPGIRQLWNCVSGMERIRLFSLIAAVTIVVFYCIPLSKRSVYLMPAYPFIAIFIAQYIQFLRENKIAVNKIFGIFVALIACIAAFLVLFTVIFPVIDPVLIVSYFVKKQRVLDEVSFLWQSLNSPKILYILLFATLILFIYLLFNSLRKNNYLKLLYATIALYLALWLVLDGIFLPAYKDGICSKSIAENLKQKYPLTKDNVFVLNNLLEYSNMYSLNYYFNNNFRDFEKTGVREGYFLVGEASFEKLVRKYENKYQFDLLEKYVNKNRDGERIVCLYSFKIKTFILND